ncbi:MAG: sigma-70 family RNA polymerase sigma factor [Nannocystaceae bacterium]|nr:sigma-70 family RNA polymerase sigma factor [Nannocystaceae bacterium]
MSAATSGVYEAQPQRAADDSRAQFVALYRAHAAFTWAVLRRIGVPPASIDDAMQELWVTAHRRLATLHAPAAARAWLYGIARRVASHHRRTELRHRRKLDALAQQDHSPGEHGRDGSMVVESILASLDERVREAFVLSELEGWTAAEIARATGANANTVSWRVRVARQQLRERLAVLDGGDAAVGAAVIELRDRTRAPRGTTQQCWLALAPALGSSSGAAVGGGAVSWAGLKLAALALGVAVTTAVGIDVTTRGPAASTQPREPVPASATLAAPSLTAAVAEPPATMPPPPPPPLQRPAPVSAPQRAVIHPSPTTPPSPPADDPTSRQPDTLAAEDAELLASAKRAFAAGHLDEAEDLLSRHAQRFADSELADVRALVTVELLCARGRRAEARARAQAALATMPAAATASRLRSACPATQD